MDEILDLLTQAFEIARLEYKDNPTIDSESNFHEAQTKLVQYRSMMRGNLGISIVNNVEGE